MTDEPNVEWIPCNNFFPNRNGYKPQFLILHGTAGGTSAESIANYFKSTENSNNPVAAHYVVDQAGSIVQVVRETDGAYANGVLTTGHDPFWRPDLNPNLITISIEHVKVDTQNAAALSPAQQAAAFPLIKHICERHGIPKRQADANGGITTHASIDPINRARCPGTYPWAELWQYLQQQQGDPMVPTGWHDDGTTLVAPNGIRVVAGFRSFILSHPWNPDDYPLEEEQGANPVEESNPGLGGGTRQTFRMTMLEWTPARGVFVAWIGQELLKVRSLLVSSLHPTVALPSVKEREPVPPLVALSSSPPVRQVVVPYISTYEIGRSEARDVASCLASLACFACPNRWLKPDQLASEIYQQFCGKDTSDNATPMTAEQVVSWCRQAQIETFVVTGPTSHDELHAELLALSKNDLPALLVLADGSQLQTVSGQSLHPFKMSPAQHAIILLGFTESGSDTCLILDPAAACPPLPFPTPVKWEVLVGATITTALAVMPHGIAAPRAGFRFWQNGREMAWPQGPTDPAQVREIRRSIQTERTRFLQAAADYTAAEEASFLATLQALGLKGAASA